MIASFFIAGLWNYPIIKDSIHLILDPTAGYLMNLNATFGMLVVVALITLVTTLVQKYGTDQETLKKLKEEQKIMQEDMKKYKNDPEKMMEFNKKQMEHMPKIMDITMRPMIYTFIPFILFFRWFNDYFTVNSVKFLGFMTWFWFYLIASIVFSSIFRKVLKVY
jgi:Predicted membrane protein